MDKTLEQRVAELEREVAELKKQVSAQPSVSLITALDVRFLEKQLETMLTAVKKIRMNE